MSQETSTLRNEQSIEHKITACFERISQALRLLVQDVSQKENISPLQARIILFLYTHSSDKCRVSILSGELNMTAATISDAVKALSRKKFLLKTTDQKDKRIYYLNLSASGKKLAQRIINWQNALHREIAQFSPEQKETVLVFFMKLIASLQEKGIINLHKMCFSCRFFLDNAHPGTSKPHHCQLTNKAIGNGELNVDCNACESGIEVRQQ